MGIGPGQLGWVARELCPPLAPHGLPRHGRPVVAQDEGTVQGAALDQARIPHRLHVALTVGGVGGRSDQVPRPRAAVCEGRPTSKQKVRAPSKGGAAPTPSVPVFTVTVAGGSCRGA